jgi:hypothetical protein
MSNIFRYFQFGFGSSAGRSAFRKVEKNFLLIVFLIVLTMLLLSPVWAGFDRRRGNELRSDKPNRSLLNFAIALVPLLLSGYLLFYPASDGQPIVVVTSPHLWMIAAATYTFLAFHLGQFFGKVAAVSRYAEEDKIEYNRQFLVSNDISEGDDLWIGPDGETLRIVEREDNRILFMAVGRRNKRAFITMNDAGYYQEYSGIVGIGEI